MYSKCEKTFHHHGRSAERALQAALFLSVCFAPNYMVTPKGNVYMHLREELGTIYQDQAFAHLFSPCGKPALAPWRLLLVCLLQFAEGLSDRQAADAVRGRVDWKYLLG